MKKLIATILVLSLCLSLWAYTYSDLNAMILGNNLNLLKAKEDVQTALLDYNDAKWGYSPTIDLTVTGSYLFNPIEAVTLQKDQLMEFLGIGNIGSGLGDDYLTLYKGQENMMYQFQLQITQPVVTWGKITNAVNLYRSIYNARTLQMVQMSEQNSTELQSRMAALVYLNQIRNLLVEETALADRLVNLSQQAQVNGILLELDVKDAMVQASQLDVTLAQLDNQIDEQLRSVAKMCGLESLTMDQIELQPDEKKYLSVLNTDLERWEYRATDQSRTTFQLLAKLEEIASIANKIAGVSVNWKPDLALVATLGYSGSRFPLIETDWYRQDSANSTLTLALKANVWDGGKAVRNVSRTESQKASAALDTSLGKDEILEQLRSNYHNIELAKIKITYYDDKVEACMEKVKRQNELLDAGAASETDLLKAEMELRAVKIERIQELIGLSASYYVVSYLGS